MNKVHFNLKNVHYAKLTVGVDGAVTYGTPTAVPGAVSLALSPEGNTTKFYADGIAYYVSTANNGYTGDLELALVPDEFRKDILGEVEDVTSKVLTEYSNTEAGLFALLFEFDGDVKAIRHVMYNCSAARPSVEGQTVTASKDPTTEKLTITASMLADGRVKAKTGAETPAAIYDNWYKTVWQPTAEVKSLAEGT